MLYDNTTIRIAEPMGKTVGVILALAFLAFLAWGPLEAHPGLLLLGLGLVLGFAALKKK
jgi:hypothetical protein